jgi:hypothetical protein
MSATRDAAGLTWTSDDGMEWKAEDDIGAYTVVEWEPGRWMEVFHPHDESCGCGIPPSGGGDWPDFEAAATAVTRLGRPK